MKSKCKMSRCFVSLICLGMRKEGMRMQGKDSKLNFSVSKEKRAIGAVQKGLRVISRILFISSVVCLIYVVCNIGVGMSKSEQRRYVHRLQNGADAVLDQTELWNITSNAAMFPRLGRELLSDAAGNVVLGFGNLASADRMDNILKKLSGLLDVTRSENPIRSLAAVWGQNFVNMFDRMISNAACYWEEIQEFLRELRN